MPLLIANLREWGFVAKSALLVCSDHEEWARRLGERGSAINHLVTSLEEIRGFRGTLDSVPFDGELVLDTTSSVATVGALAAQCVEYLRQDAE